MFAKCANAACAEAFRYKAGGIFFRFSKQTPMTPPDDESSTESGNIHNVEHYWLCPRCAQLYSLVYFEGAGVILKPRWTEEPIASILKRLAAA
ncbi:MAG: hypothetical protein ACRD5M_02665 [Candidatus Acidiferrales bacterium]